MKTRHLKAYSLKRSMFGSIRDICGKDFEKKLFVPKIHLFMWIFSLPSSRSFEESTELLNTTEANLDTNVFCSSPLVMVSSLFSVLPSMPLHL